MSKPWLKGLMIRGKREKLKHKIQLNVTLLHAKSKRDDGVIFVEYDTS